MGFLGYSSKRLLKLLLLIFDWGGGAHILWFMNNKTKLIATAQRSQRLLQQAHLNPLSLSLSSSPQSSICRMQLKSKWEKPLEENTRAFQASPNSRRKRKNIYIKLLCTLSSLLHVPWVLTSPMLIFHRFFLLGLFYFLHLLCWFCFCRVHACIIRHFTASPPPPPFSTSFSDLFSVLKFSCLFSYFEISHSKQDIFEIFLYISWLIDVFEQNIWSIWWMIWQLLQA